MKNGELKTTRASTNQLLKAFRINLKGKKKILIGVKMHALGKYFNREKE